MGGLSPEEDVFAPVSKAVKTRWAWLAINLCTAFIASRVIGLFEHTISQLVALAALMPIVAGIGGNTGNQTITMIVRALALHQIEVGNISRLMLRELGVAIINGVVWGGIMGVITWLLYGDAAMGGVMTLAMLLNLLLAALMGVVIPMTMLKMGRDPAVGSSVLITALTDTGGFFHLPRPRHPVLAVIREKPAARRLFSPFCRRVCVNAVKSAIPVGFPLALYYPLPINRLNSSTS